MKAAAASFDSRHDSISHFVNNRIKNDGAEAEIFLIISKKKFSSLEVSHFTNQNLKKLKRQKKNFHLIFQFCLDEFETSELNFPPCSSNRKLPQGT